jgi:hypothetical protein
MLAAGETSRAIVPLQQLGLDESYARIFTPFGFEPSSGGRMVPTYPAGTPGHLALAASIGGWSMAPFLVAPLAAMGCLVLIVLLARQLGVSRGLSYAAAVLLAAVPVFIAHAVQPVSDVLAVFWGLVAIWAGVRSASQTRFAVLAGLAFAAGVAVRPTNLLLAVPLLLAMRVRIRPVLIAAVSALPVVVTLLWYNEALYGNPFVTGYGSPAQLLAWNVFPKCAAFHARMSALAMTPVLMPLGLAVAFLRRVPLLHRVLLVGWFGLFFVFYSFYDICGSPESSRFLLPAFPALVIGFLLVIDGVRRRWIVTLCVLLVVALEVKNVGSQHILHIDKSESIYPEAVRWSQQWVREDAVVLTGLLSGAYYYYTDRVTIRWNEVQPEQARVLLAAYPPDAPWYAVLSRVEGDGEALARHVPGQWDAVASHRDVTLWRLRR